MINERNTVVPSDIKIIRSLLKRNGVLFKERITDCGEVKVVDFNYDLPCIPIKYITTLEELKKGSMTKKGRKIKLSVIKIDEMFKYKKIIKIGIDTKLYILYHNTVYLFNNDKECDHNDVFEKVIADCEASLYNVKIKDLFVDKLSGDENFESNMTYYALDDDGDKYSPFSVSKAIAYLVPEKSGEIIEIYLH